MKPVGMGLIALAIVICFGMQSHSEAESAAPSGVDGGPGVTSTADIRIVGAVGRSVIGASIGGSRVLSGGMVYSRATAESDHHRDLAASRMVLTEMNVMPACGQNFPNPFYPETVLAFPVTESGRVTVTVYNIAGQLVKTLHDGDLSAGVHEVVWDGRSDAGDEVSAGVYFYYLEVGEETFSNRMLFMK